jgi:hypothetical protein
MPFVFSLFARAWTSFLIAIGTTGLGFFVSNIWLFLIALIVTHFVIWIVRGRDKMREHAKENFKIGVLVYVIVFITGWGPIFGYHLFFKIPRDIRNGAAHQPGHKLPEKLAHLPSPSWIYELSPPSISIYIKPISGFTFVAKLPPGNYSFKDRQEYELTIKNNGGITATSIKL